MVCDCYALDDSSVQVEWHLPNRRLAVPAELDPIAASRHLIQQTSRHPGLVLDFADEARDYFDSFGVAFDTRCSNFRKGSNADSAAEEGIACALPCMQCRPCGVCSARHTVAL